MPAAYIPTRTHDRRPDLPTTSRPKVPLERYVRSPPYRITSARAAILRRAAPSGLSRTVRYLFSGNDGRQHRARNQLLGRVPEIPFPSACRLRRPVALAAIPPVLGRLRRTCRSVRSPPPYPVRHGPVHVGLARLELLLHHRHARRMECHGAAVDPRLRRRAVGDPRSGAAL